MAIPIWGYAQVPPIQVPKGEVISTGKIKEEMEKLRSLNPSDFIRQIDDYRNTVEKFIQHKKRVCSGEFSKIVLGEGTIGTQKKTLAKEEKDNCFQELLNLHVAYIDNIFTARSRFLSHQHDVRMKDMDVARKKSIENIKNKFTKKRRKKKKRR